MKHILLFLGLIILSAFGFAQNRESTVNYEIGNRYFAEKDYQQAVKYYTISLEQLPVADAYVNRALSYIAMLDSCNYCSDMMAAALLGDEEAIRISKKKCVYTLVDYKISDSIKLKHPEILHFEVVRQRCSLEKTIYAIIKKNGIISSVEFSEIDKGPVFTKVPDMPVFTGGNQALDKFISENLKYPEADMKKRIEGPVYVDFIVNTDGSVSNVKITKGIGGSCDQEALRVVKMMPCWIPGRKNGEEVRVKVNMPLYFRAVLLEEIMEKADKNYKTGNQFLKDKEYEKAVEYFTLSIKQHETADTYYKRAMSYDGLSDSCNYCKDMHLASMNGDKEATEHYTRKCVILDTIRSKADSIREEYPGYRYTLKQLQICTTDTVTVYYDVNHKPITSIFQKMPEFQGGEMALAKFLGSNIVYPQSAKERGIQGTIYVSFVIKKNGDVSDIQILRGIGGGCDEEALRVVSMMPRWNPGTRKGIPVRVQFNMPIRYTLN